MKSSKYQLLKSDYDFACKELKQRREMIEQLREQNKLLTELAKNQYDVLKFVNKIMFETSKHQRTLPIEEQNTELLDLSWSTNDCISDNPRQRELIEVLKTKDIDITCNS